MSDSRASEFCGVDGCHRSAHWRDGGARGWCRVHYARWYRHGDPEGGGPEIGDQQHFLTEVVFAFDRDECLRWPFHHRDDGYALIYLDEEMQRVNRLVCEEENGLPPTPEHHAAHSCGHSWCVARKHLSWKTPVQNAADRIIHGTHRQGEDHGMAKLVEGDVRQIRALRGQRSQRIIGELYGISAPQVCAIQTGKNWGWLS